MFRKAATLQSAVAVTGNGTVSYASDGSTDVLLEIVKGGTPTFSIQPEQSADNFASTVYAVGSALTATGLFPLQIWLPFFRARVVSFADGGSGTDTVTARMKDTAAPAVGNTGGVVINSGTVTLAGTSAVAGTVAVSGTSAVAGTVAVSSGNMGGFTATVQATPTVQAAAYAAGNVIGGLLTLTSAARTAGSGLIQSCACSFNSGVQPSLDVIFFSANPSGSTITDKTAVAIVAADVAKIIAVAHLTDVTLIGASAPSYVQAEQQALPFALGGSVTTMYAAVVTRTAVTLTSTSDMTFSARVLQD